MAKAKRTMLYLTTALCLMFAMTAFTSAAERERDIDELMYIVRALIENRDAANPLGADSRLPENLHLHPGFAGAISWISRDSPLFERNIRELRYYHALEVERDARLALLTELKFIFLDAIAIQDRNWGVATDDFVLSTWSGPQPRFNMFSVRFSCDTFLPLADIILDFVGIPEYMLEIGESRNFDDFWPSFPIEAAHTYDITAGVITRLWAIIASVVLLWGFAAIAVAFVRKTVV